MKDLKTFHLIAALALATLAVSTASVAQPQQTVSATVTIRADRPGPTINPDIFGQFAEHLGNGIYGGVWVGKDSPIPNTNGYRNDVLAALKELHVPVIRWPGGCFADEYHWRDGVGPSARRPVTVNTNWGGVPETNAFGTNEFLDFTGMIGAKAYVNGNLGTGTPEEMADWLKYMTSDQDTTLTRLRRDSGRDRPWKIDFFAIGNENWGCGGNMRPAYYADLFRRYTEFLKTPPGARPLFIASGGYNSNTDWTKVLITAIPRNLGAISYHYYTIPSPTHNWQAKGPTVGFGENQWLSTLVNALKIEDYIKRNIAIMNKYDPQKRVGFFVDEWGTWYDPEPGRNPGFLYQQNTMRDAVVAAATLNIFTSHADRVRMANIAQMVNVLQAMILTDGPRMVLTPTYHVFYMYIPFQGASLLPTVLKTPRYRLGKASVPAVSVAAARDKNGVLQYALVNLDPNRSRRVSTTIAGARPRSVEGSILRAKAMDARNTFDDPDAVHPQAFSGARLIGKRLEVTLPPKSIVVLSLE